MHMLNVKLESFEGPLDLLYQLIEKNQIDIYDIPIAELAEQYIAFLSAHNMESMSEFVLMAATLLEIKSKMLLPSPKKDEITQDPRQELIERLIEYKRFKQAAAMLENRGEFAERYIFRKPEPLLQTRTYPTVEPHKLLQGITLEQLLDIFESVLLRRELKVDKLRSSFNSVQREVFTVDDKIGFIKSLLITNGLLNFYDISGMSKAEKVATFLAVLELIKRKEIKIIQQCPFDDFSILREPVL